MFELSYQLKLNDFLIDSNGQVSLKRQNQPYALIIAYSKSSGGSNVLNGYYNDLRKKYIGTVGIYSFDTQKEPYLTQMLGITKYPTVLIMRQDGSKTYYVSNDFTRPSIERFINTIINDMSLKSVSIKKL